MIEVLPNIFVVDVPLINSPLKLLHTYLIKGKVGERNLLIDTGFNQEDGRRALLSSLEELGCELDNTDIFLTHCHSDHSGLMGAVKTEKNRAFTSAVDAKYANMLATNESSPSITRRAKEAGFAKEITAKPHLLSALGNCERPIDYSIVDFGDSLEYGGYKLVVKDFSGHTQGQVGLHEEREGIIFAGDHILDKISPNIVYWNEEFDSLACFMKNLREAAKLEAKITLSGHRAHITDHKKRCEELCEHHDRRLEEVVQIIKSGEKCAFDTAANMHWDYGKGDFLNWQFLQQFFAAGEALAHLECLRNQSVLKKHKEDEKFVYSIN